jgi:hypothetical protein
MAELSAEVGGLGKVVPLERRNRNNNDEDDRSKDKKDEQPSLMTVVQVDIGIGGDDIGRSPAVLSSDAVSPNGHQEQTQDQHGGKDKIDKYAQIGTLHAGNQLYGKQHDDETCSHRSQYHPDKADHIEEIPKYLFAAFRHTPSLLLF